MNQSNAAPDPGDYYTPGYSIHKLLMVVFGVALFVFGLTQLWFPLRLTFFGQSANAAAVRVVKVKAGLADMVLRTDAEIEAQREPRDRSYIFWNEFSFRTGSGQSVEVRANVGSHVGPLFTLLDEDGLPTIERVCYDPTDPKRAIFPFLISTWLAASVLALGGLTGAIIGSVLLYWANKPIKLPHIPSAAEIEAAHAQQTRPSP